jgi:large subunit ribosomal protein L21
MYAVIESGGKQYRVELGSEIQVDRLAVQPGDSITLDRVLLVADGDGAEVGRPLVEGAVVRADVLGQDRGEKVVVFKYRPKARRRVKKGFRAELTTLRISEISHAGRSAASEAETRAARDEDAARAAAEAAARKAEADQALAARLGTPGEPAAEGGPGHASRERAKAAAVVVDQVEPASVADETAAEQTPAVEAAQVAPDPGPDGDDGALTDDTDGGERAGEAAAVDAGKDG